MKELKVLYIDSDSNAQETLSTLLQDQVHSLLHADGVQQGLVLFRENHPDVILLNHKLESSFSILEKMKSVPILCVVDEETESQEYLQCSHAGADGFLGKPYQKDTLFSHLKKIKKTISQKRKTEAQKQYIDFLMKSNSEFIVTLAGKEIRQVNSTFLDYLGYASVKEMKKDTPHIQSLFHHEFCHEWVDHVFEYPEHNIVYRDKEPYIVRVKQQGQERKLIFTQIGEHYRRITTDRLTGLSSREKYYEALEAEIIKIERSGDSLTMMMFEVEAFPGLLHKHGIDTANEILKGIARLVTSNIRISDTFTRLKASKFVVIFPSMVESVAQTRAEKLMKDFEGTITIGEKAITCGFGIVRWKKQENKGYFMKRAEAALAQAKFRGPNNVVIY